MGQSILYMVIIFFTFIFLRLLVGIRSMVRLSHRRLRVNQLYFTFPLFLFVIFSLSVLEVAGQQNMYNTIRRRSDLSSLSFDSIEEQPLFKQSIDALLDSLKGKKVPDRKIALLSNWDTFFLVKTKSVNIADSNNSDYFTKISQLEDLVKNMAQSNPSMVYSDHVVYFDHIKILQDRLSQYYHPVRNIGFLDEWEKN